MLSNENEHLFKTQNVQDLLDIWRGRGKPIVIWAGAGLSAPAKLPSWAGLRTQLEQDARNHAASLSGAESRQRISKLEAISKMSSNWKAFELLEELAPASFQGTIRAALVNTLRCTIPQAYIALWNLNIKGFLTLNVDGLAGRAFSESSANKFRLHNRGGFEIRTLVGTITDNDSRFIGNLHGTPEDPNGWVFTEKKLNALLSDPSYLEFVRDCVKYCTIVLLGISANDRAVIEHFTRAVSSCPNAGPHFWFASADQTDAAQQVESQGIRTTLYRNTSGNHEFILDLLAAIKEYKPTLIPASPVIQVKEDGYLALGTTLPQPNELVSETPNLIREKLNREATMILAKDGDEQYAKFEKFCENYSRAIHSSTFVSQRKEDDADRIGKYSAQRYVKEGGFAKVWYGSGDDGEPVAIKVFKHEVREQPDLLKAFRRGVRSMRFLQKHAIPGVVKFIDASEIPPVVIMEWVEGITLHDAVKAGATTEWRQRIKIARDLAAAVYAVHNTPERVIHRDLRPQNVMLRDYYTEGVHAEVVVLDFDLSWHLGALEKSVYVSGGTAYLAPEQLNESAGMTTRSAAVDSFGFGMTLFFIVTGTDPVFFAQARPDWAQTVLSSSTNRQCKEWRSLPRRVARLIVNSTLDNQNRRMTFSQIVSELDKLWTALDEPENVIDVNLVAEEIFSRVDLFSTYKVTELGSFTYQSPSRISVSIEPYPFESGLSIKFSFVQAGHEKFSILEKLGAEFKNLQTRFSHKFNIILKTVNLNHGDFHCEIVVAFENRKGFIDSLSETLHESGICLINIAGAY